MNSATPPWRTVPFWLAVVSVVTSVVRLSSWGCRDQARELMPGMSGQSVTAMQEARARARLARADIELEMALVSSKWWRSVRWHRRQLGTLMWRWRQALADEFDACCDLINAGRWSE